MADVVLGALQELPVAACRNIVSRLETDHSASIQVIGDSTGDETSEWVYLLAAWLGLIYPDVAVVYQLWDDAIQDYDGRVLVQGGAAGERSIRFQGSQTRSLAPTEVGDISGDLELRLDLSMDDWTPPGDTTLIARWGSGAAKGFRLQVSPASTLKLLWTADGSNIKTAVSTAALTVTAGQRIQIRVTLAVASGAVNFYFRAPGATPWTHLGVTSTQGAAAVNNPAGRSYELGGDGGGSNVSTSNIYAAEVRQGILGPILNPQGVGEWVSANDLSPDAGSPTLYVVNGSKAGANLAYMTDAIRGPKLLPNYQDSLLLVCDGHNEVALQIGKAWKATLDTALAYLKTHLPSSEVAFVTQNPETSTNANKQYARQQITKTWCSRNGLGCIDTYRAFEDYCIANSVSMTTLIDQTDGQFVHPVKPLGTNIEAFAVQRSFAASMTM